MSRFFILQTISSIYLKQLNLNGYDKFHPFVLILILYFLSSTPFVYLFLVAETAAEIGVSASSVLWIAVSERPLRLQRESEKRNGATQNLSKMNYLFTSIDFTSRVFAIPLRWHTDG